MVQLVITIVTIFLIFVTFVIGLSVLAHLYHEKGLGHAFLGFFVLPYPFIWGWINAKRLRIIEIMMFWTFIILLAVIFPIMMSFQAFGKVTAFIEDSELTTAGRDEPESFLRQPALAVGNENAISMGSLAIGDSVTGEIEDLFDVHNWSFSGNAGQTITIQGNASGDDATDLRVNLLGPDGSHLTGDDDSGDDYNALISSFALPSSGQYIIQVDAWQTGKYELILD